MSSASSRSSSPKPTGPQSPFAAALRRATVQILDAVNALEVLNPVLIIDGRSGAGKSSLAAALVANWPLEGRVQLVGLDSIYPGWDGLDAGVEIARGDVLVPHARGLMGVWRRYDWQAGSLAEAHAVDPSLPLIVEGSGILAPATRRLCDIAIWVDAPDAARKTRALERDGEVFRPHWTQWARQEAVHITRDAPESLASITVRLP